MALILWQWSLDQLSSEVSQLVVLLGERGDRQLPMPGIRSMVLGELGRPVWGEQGVEILVLESSTAKVRRGRDQLNRITATEY